MKSVTGIFLKIFWDLNKARIFSATVSDKPMNLRGLVSKAKYGYLGN
jgi:hypothetical protein